MTSTISDRCEEAFSGLAGRAEALRAATKSLLQQVSRLRATIQNTSQQQSEAVDRLSMALDKLCAEARELTPLVTDSIQLVQRAMEKQAVQLRTAVNEVQVGYSCTQEAVAEALEQAEVEVRQTRTEQRRSVAERDALLRRQIDMCSQRAATQDLVCAQTTHLARLVAEHHEATAARELRECRRASMEKLAEDVRRVGTGLSLRNLTAVAEQGEWDDELRQKLRLAAAVPQRFAELISPHLPGGVEVARLADAWEAGQVEEFVRHLTQVPQGMRPDLDALRAALCPDQEE